MIGGHSQTAASLITAIHKETSAITTSAVADVALPDKSDFITGKCFEECDNYFNSYLPTIVEEDIVELIACTCHYSSEIEV